MAGGWTVRHLAATVVAGLDAWFVLAGAPHAQQISADSAALNAEILRLHQAGKYDEAAKIASRLLDIFEKQLGPDHRNVGTALFNLALLYQRQGRYADAEPLYKRGLGISEKALGFEHPEVGTVLNSLAD